MLLQAPGQPLGDTQLLTLSGVDGRIENIRGRWSQLSGVSAGAVERGSPPARYRHSLVAVGPREFVLFGGTDGTKFFGDVWHLGLHWKDGTDSVLRILTIVNHRPLS